MKVLSLWEGIKLLKKYRIPFVLSEITKKGKDLEKIAKKIGFPMILKISSRKIIHKTEAKAIRRANSLLELKKEFNDLYNLAKRIDKNFDGIVVQKMLRGVELIVGTKKDEQFGHTLLFGMGGIYTEIFKDFSLRVIPLTRKDVKEMIEETKAYKILSGFRGKKYDIKAIENFVFRISKFVEKNKNIIELDINPLFALEKNCFAADVRIVVK